MDHGEGGADSFCPGLAPFFSSPCRRRSTAAQTSLTQTTIGAVMAPPSVVNHKQWPQAKAVYDLLELMVYEGSVDRQVAHSTHNAANQT